MHAPDDASDSGDAGGQSPEKIRVVHPRLHDVGLERADRARETHEIRGEDEAPAHPEDGDVDAAVSKDRSVPSFIEERHDAVLRAAIGPHEPREDRLGAPVREARDDVNDVHPAIIAPLRAP